MRVYLDQIGCRLNYSEMESLARRLSEAGHTVVDDPAAAQVIVFNSCAVTGGAVRDSRKRIGSLHRANEAAAIALTGCYATLDPQAAGAMPGVALVAPNRDKELLPLLLEQWSAAFEDVRTLALSGQKIEAIKRYRDKTGAGMAEAKEYVDSIA